MTGDTLIRRTLVFSVLFNLVGAAGFLHPGSIGQLMGLPPSGPFVYRGFCAATILLFAGAYYWLARQPELNRPLVVIAAVGKASFFVVLTISWLLGEVPVLGLLGASVDLGMAAIFAHWAWSSGTTARPA